MIVVDMKVNFFMLTSLLFYCTNSFISVIAMTMLPKLEAWDPFMMQITYTLQCSIPSCALRMALIWNSSSSLKCRYVIHCS